jgi:hypothetical protein
MVEAAGVEPDVKSNKPCNSNFLKIPTYNMPTTIPRSRVPLELKRKRAKAAQAPGRGRTIDRRKLRLSR